MALGCRRVYLFKQHVFIQFIFDLKTEQTGLDPGKKISFARVKEVYTGSEK